MKKAIAITVIFLLIISLVGCAGNEKKIVGAWQLTNDNGSQYGMALVFSEDGTLSYGVESLDLDEKVNKEAIESALASLSSLYNVKYEVIDNDTIKLSTSALFGFIAKDTEVTYELKKDTLTFDGSVYKRVG